LIAAPLLAMTIPTGLAAPDNDAPVSPLAWYWFSNYALPRCDTGQTVAAVTDGKNWSATLQFRTELDQAQIQ
jgi:hypothetical protein